MMEFLDEKEFNAAFQTRLRETRVGMKWSYPQMARALGLKVDAYKKIENRSRAAFPLYLLPQLIFVTGRPYSYWTGSKPASVTTLRPIR